MVVSEKAPKPKHRRMYTVGSVVVIVLAVAGGVALWNWQDIRSRTHSGVVFTRSQEALNKANDAFSSGVPAGVAAYDKLIAGAKTAAEKESLIYQKAQACTAHGSYSCAASAYVTLYDEGGQKDVGVALEAARSFAKAGDKTQAKVYVEHAKSNLANMADGDQKQFYTTKVATVEGEIK